MDHVAPSASRSESSTRRQRSSTASSSRQSRMERTPSVRRMSRLEPRLEGQSWGSHKLSYSRRLSSMQGWGATRASHHTTVANTYRMGPDSQERFRPVAAERVIRGVLDSFLGGERYDKTMCVSLCKSLADMIKERMKDQGWSPRYKYVCTVSLGEVKDQGMAVTSRCVWATDTDSFASVHLKKADLFAVATLYAVYHE